MRIARKRNRFGASPKRPLRFFEIARLLVRFDHIARVIVNANYSIVRVAVEFSEAGAGGYLPIHICARIATQ